MEDCNKQKDPRRVAAGKKAAEARKKKRASAAQRKRAALGRPRRTVDSHQDWRGSSWPCGVN